MSNCDSITQHLIAIQCDIFRLAKRDHALSPARLSALSGLPKTTIESWTKGTAMPAFGLARLSPFIPDELITLLFEPFGKHVETSETDESDLDELGCETAGFTADYVQAVSDGKITPMERAKLAERALRIAAKANSVRAA